MAFQSTAWEASGRWPRADWGVPGSRERRAAREDILREKLGSALLPAMRAADVTMWLVLDRENAPDPMHEDVGGGYSGPGAAYMFWDNGSNVENTHLSSNRQPLDSPIERLFDCCLVDEPSPDAFARALRQAVASRRPDRIAVNVSDKVPAAAGLSASCNRFLQDALGHTYAARLVSSDVLVHRFRGTRTPIETAWYRRLQAWTSRWLTEALTGDHVVPGTTTVRALSDWCEDRATELALTTATDHGRYPVIVWFGDRMAIPGVAGFDRYSSYTPDDPRELAIEAGNLVTLDGGLRFLNLSSDMKRSAYVLRRGERDAPASLREGWQRMLQVAEICARHLRADTTAHEATCQIGADLNSGGFIVDADIRVGSGPRVAMYGHSVGNDVHEVGSRLRLPPVPDQCDWAMLDGEWISVEFHVVVAGERERPWYVRFEQTGQLRTYGFEWLVPLQRDLILIDSRREDASVSRRTPE